MDHVDTKEAIARLEHELSSDTNNGTATLIVKNLVPNQYGITIVATGATFFYLGGGSDTDTKNGLTLSYGESVTLQSKRPAGCVITIASDTKAFSSSSGLVSDYPFTDNADAGKCFLTDEIDLSPTLQVTQDELAERDVKKMFVMRSRSIDRQ